MGIQRFRMILQLAKIAGVIAVFGMTGCVQLNINGWQDNQYSASEAFAYDLPVTTQTAFTISGINGSIDITGDQEADTVSVTGMKRVDSYSEADALNQLDRLDVEITTREDGIDVRTDQPAITNGRNYIVDYAVILPAGMTVLAETTNGSVLISVVENDVNVQTTNGSVFLDNVTGDADLGTTNGSIVLTNVNGSVRALSTNGQVAGDVILPAGGTCRFTTTNGSVDLDIPQTTSAEFSAETSNGIVTVSSLDMTNQVTSDHSMTGTLGGGDGTIALRTTNGNINARGY